MEPATEEPLAATWPTGAARGADYEVRFVQDVRIPTGDSAATLSADIYLPACDRPVPALLMAVPYRKDAGAGIWYEASLRWFAERGYACMLMDLRGTGSSDGPMRPPFHPGEGDDGVAAIDWVASQPWCDGGVGMWGESYCATTTMRTAARRPPQLKAIVPIMGMIDPGRDWAHPNGALGGHSFARFGAINLMMQLTPPLHGFHSSEEHQRWLERLEGTEPYIVDLFRRGPSDPVWRERAIDASEISTPSLFFGGWRDSLCDSTVRAYESVCGPKRLIMGPWTHTMPHASPFEPIDFLSLALQWWDHWLLGTENGAVNRPPVSLYIQGERPGWRGYDSWPLERKAGLALATDADAVLTTRGGLDGSASSHVPAFQELGRYVPDPTVGALSGMWGISTGGFGLPQDQHDDDIRSFSVTSDALTSDMLIVGRPRVVVGLTKHGRVPRIVARLADVDERARSTFITGGIACPPDAAVWHSVDLWPTCYRVPAGHRVRVVVSDAAFPRLWPLADPTQISIFAIELFAATVDEDDGVAVSFARPQQDGPVLGAEFEPDWRISRDLVRDGIEVLLGHKSTAYTPGREHRVESDSSICATVRKSAPQAAKISILENATARLKTGERIVITTDTQLTSETLWVKGEVEIDGMLMFSRTWREQRPSGQ